MSRPPKPIAELTRTGKTHLTKEQIKTREEAEAKARTGSPMSERPEVRENADAHKEFKRMKRLMTAIGKNDSAYTAVINRYCKLYAECLECERGRCITEHMIDDSRRIIDEIEERLPRVKNAETLSDISKSIEATAKALYSLTRQINTYDSMAMSKRKMMFDIEKENAMTVSAMLRAIPKEPEKDNTNPILAALAAASEDDDDED